MTWGCLRALSRGDGPTPGPRPASKQLSKGTNLEASWAALWSPWDTPTRRQVSRGSLRGVLRKASCFSTHLPAGLARARRLLIFLPINKKILRVYRPNATDSGIPS